MKALLAKMNQNAPPSAGSRSHSIASSVDDHDEDQQSNNSDESQPASSAATLKPKVKRDKSVKGAKKGSVASADKVEPPAKKPISRIDTNMVKLKLLDATRKSIMDKTKKVCVSSYAQTDTFKTKLCKDQSIDAQDDLRVPCDASTETEFELTATVAKDGTLVITASCGINTDRIATDSISTQTIMPRSDVSFKKFMNSKHSVQYDDDMNTSGDDMGEELFEIERRMKSRKKYPRQLSRSKSPVIVIDEMDDTEMTAETLKPDKVPTKVKRDSDSEFEDSIQEDLKHRSAKASTKPSSPPDATFNSWHGMDVPDKKFELPKSYFHDGPTPWSNFKDLVLGQRFLNARLSTAPMSRSMNNFQQATWSEPQIKLVNELLMEAQALMEMFDQVAMLLGPDIKLHNVSDVEEFFVPPAKNTQKMANYCDKLEASLQRLNHIQSGSQPIKIPTN